MVCCLHLCPDNWHQPLPGEYPALLHNHLIYNLAIAAIRRRKLQDSLVLQIALHRSVESDWLVIDICCEVRSAQNGIIVESGLKIALDTLISGRTGWTGK
jgi:hypothetical protein